MDEAICRHCRTVVPPGAVSCPSCGKALSTLVPEISGYEILGGLGEGGMGAVFLARDEVLGRRVAIKVVSEKIAGDPQARERFLREARTLATVEHPSVVRVYSFGELAHTAYLVLEYVEGETLADRIAREGALPTEQVVGILRQIVAALEAAHDHGIVHRDIKPSNILIGRRGDIRVADFGLAKPVSLGESSNTLTQTGYLLGTPHYVSPEQALGKPVDFRTDVYSLGILLYEMLTAERPFQGITPIAIVAKMLHEPLPDIRVKRPDLPRELVDLLEWMTRKDPDQRPSYPEIRGILAGDAPVTRPFPEVGSRRGPMVGIAIAMVLGLVLGVGLHLLRPSFEPEPIFAPRGPGDMAVAVAPFWGPDDLSSREGRVMAALVERSIQSRLGSNVRIAGIDETEEPVRSHEEARELGRRLGAGVVVWGEALALRDETEIQPSFTLVDLATAPSGAPEAAAAIPRKDQLDLEDITKERGGVPLRLSSDAPDQIEMRRTSAEGVGEMVTFLTGLHNLYVRDDARSALPLFERSSPTADVLRHQAQALIRIEREDEAIEILERALALDPTHGGTHAQLADLLWTRGDRVAASEHALRAAATGEPIEAVQAIVHEGRLFAQELYETVDGEVRHSGYLLVIDPESGRVLERHFMPGEVISLGSAGDLLTITWTDRGMEGEFLLTWRAGAFDPPICCYGGNLLRRMNGVKSGMEIGINFMQGVHGSLEKQESRPRFALQKDPEKIHSGKPASLEELDRFLRTALDRDSTQPWYQFHLGFVQRETSGEDQARRTWSAMLDRDWPGVPYWELSWMARTFERLGEREWADRAFEKALEIRRQNPQPVEWSILIDRLIVAPFVRLPESHLDDPERAYQWLVRARELTGPTEGERMAASIWSSYFRRSGDEARSRSEARIASTGFDWMVYPSRLDHLLYPLLSLLIATPVLGLLLLFRGWRRARTRPLQAVPRGSRPAIGSPIFLSVAATATIYLALGRSQGQLQAVLLGLLVFWLSLVLDLAVARARNRELSAVRLTEGILLAMGVGGLAGSWLAGSITIGIASSLLLLTSLELRAVGLPWRNVVRRIAWREKIIFTSITILLLILFGVFAVQVAKIARAAAMNVGITDSLGHPQQTIYFERLLAKEGSPELRYLSAVSHHLARNFDRAIALYEKVPNDGRAAEGLAAAREGRVEVTVPSGFETIDAIMEGAWRDLPLAREEIYSSELAMPVVGGSIVVIAALLLCAVFLSAGSEARSETEPVGRAAMIIGYVLPSYWWIRTGRTLRGSVTLLLLVFVLLLAIVLPRTIPDSGAPGILSAIAIPNISSSFPMPLPGDLDRESATETYRFDIMLAYPGAEAFWLTATLSILALLVAHFLSIREIIRFRGTDPTTEETALIPGPQTPVSVTAETETVIRPTK